MIVVNPNIIDMAIYGAVIEYVSLKYPPANVAVFALVVAFGVELCPLISQAIARDLMVEEFWVFDGKNRFMNGGFNSATHGEKFFFEIT